MTPPDSPAAGRACAKHQRDDERLPYLAWHARASEASRKGQRQTQCSGCRRWFFPWEMR